MQTRFLNQCSMVVISHIYLLYKHSVRSKTLFLGVCVLLYESNQRQGGVMMPSCYDNLEVDDFPITTHPQLLIFFILYHSDLPISGFKNK